MKIKPCDELNSKGQVGPNMGTYLRFLYGKKQSPFGKKNRSMSWKQPPLPEENFRKTNQRKQQRDVKVGSKKDPHTHKSQDSNTPGVCGFVPLFLLSSSNVIPWRIDMEPPIGGLEDDFPFQLGDVFFVSSSNAMLASGGTNISHPYHRVVK